MPLVDKDVLEFLIEHAVAAEWIVGELYPFCIMCGGRDMKHETFCQFAEVIAKAKEALNAAG